MFDQQRQPSTVVQVRVGERDRIQPAGVQAIRDDVFALQRLATLEEAKVNEHACVPGFHQIGGTGDVACGPMQCDVHDNMAVD